MRSNRVCMSNLQSAWIGRSTLAAACLLAANVAVAADTIEAEGEFVPTATFVLHAPSDVLIESTAVREGAVVAQGEVLVVVQSDALKAELIQLEAHFQAASAMVDRLAKLVAAAAVSQAEYERAKADLNILEARLEAARVRLEAATMRSPINGQVVGLEAVAGRPFPAGAPLVQIVDRTAPWVAQVLVAERDTGKLTEMLAAGGIGGVVAVVRPAAFPEASFQARVLKLDGKMIERNGARFAAVELEVPEEWHDRISRLPIGTGAEATLRALPKR